MIQCRILRGKPVTACAKNKLNAISSFDTIPECDRQTGSQLIPHCVYVLCSKNRLNKYQDAAKRVKTISSYTERVKKL